MKPRYKTPIRTYTLFLMTYPFFCPARGDAGTINSPNKTMSTGAPCACFCPNQFAEFVGVPMAAVATRGATLRCDGQPIRRLLLVEPLPGLDLFA